DPVDDALDVDEERVVGLAHLVRSDEVAGEAGVGPVAAGEPVGGDQDGQAGQDQPGQTGGGGRVEEPDGDGREGSGPQEGPGTAHDRVGLAADQQGEGVGDGGDGGDDHGQVPAAQGRGEAEGEADA